MKNVMIMILIVISAGVSGQQGKSGISGDSVVKEILSKQVFNPTRWTVDGEKDSITTTSPFGGNVVADTFNFQYVYKLFVLGNIIYVYDVSSQKQSNSVMSREDSIRISRIRSRIHYPKNSKFGAVQK